MEIIYTESSLVESALLIAIGTLEKKNNPQAIEMCEAMKKLFYSDKVK